MKTGKGSMGVHYNGAGLRFARVAYQWFAQQGKKKGSSEELPFLLALSGPAMC